jgi:putative peptidoglycan lipid II flippase
MINFMALITLVASILIMIFADPLMRFVIAPGLSESGHALAVSMMRVIAINPFIFSIAAVIASIQQAVGKNHYQDARHQRDKRHEINHA